MNSLDRQIDAELRRLWADDGATFASMAARINDQFGVHLTREQIRHRGLVKLGLPARGSAPGSHWTPEVVAALHRLWAEHNGHTGLVMQGLQQACGITMTRQSVRAKAEREGLARPRRRAKRSEDSVWTPAVELRLRELHQAGVSYSRIAAMLSEQFRVNISRSAVCTKVDRMGLNAPGESSADAAVITLPQRAPFVEPASVTRAVSAKHGVVK